MCMSDETPTTPPAPETPPPAPPAPAPQMPAPDASGPVNDTSKLLAAFGYVIWPVALISLLLEPYKNEKWLRSHAVQALGLGVAVWVVSAVLTPLYGLGGLVGLAGFVYQIILAVKAYQGESFEVPVVHGIVKQYI